MLGALLAACGGDDGKDYGDPLSDPQVGAQARATLEGAASLPMLESDPGNAAALAKVAGMYDAVSALLNAKLVAHPPSSKAVLPLDGCFTATASKVTYAGCNDGARTVDGTLAWGGGTFTSDLTIKYTADGASYEVRQTGVLAVSAGAVVGDVSFSATRTLGDISVDYDVSADLSVTLAAGCGTAGQLEVHGLWKVPTGGQGRGDYDVWTKAVFGPNCGDVRVY